MQPGNGAFGDTNAGAQPRMTASQTEAPAGPKSLAELIGDLVRDLNGLVRSEGRLVRAELREAGREMVSGLQLLGAGAVLMAVAMLVLMQAAVVALAEYVGPMWASLIVGAVLAVIGLSLIAAGRKNLKTSNLVPERTIEQTSRDVRLAKEQL